MEDSPVLSDGYVFSDYEDDSISLDEFIPNSSFQEHNCVSPESIKRAFSTAALTEPPYFSVQNGYQALIFGNSQRVSLALTKGFIVLSPNELDVLRKSLISSARDFAEPYICANAEGWLLESLDPSSAVLSSQMDAIMESLLNVSRWDLERLLSDMMDDPAKYLTTAGFKNVAAAPKTVVKDRKVECPILAISLSLDECASLGCGHIFSSEAWMGYLKSKIESSNCFAVQCMLCSRVVSDTFVSELLPREVYDQWLARKRDSLVSMSPTLRHCTGADCRATIGRAERRPACSTNDPRVRDTNEVALRLRDVLRQNGYEGFPDEYLCTECSYHGCLQCGAGAHRPIPCELLSDWTVKNSGEGENAAWMIVNSKECPKCRKPIEKNQGCMHMTCRCSHQFCWLCMGDWETHSRTSMYSCNTYRKTAEDSEEETKKKTTRKFLERYIHYFDRYMAHCQGQKVAETMRKVCDNLNETAGVNTSPPKRKPSGPSKSSLIPLRFSKKEPPKVEPTRRRSEGSEQGQFVCTMATVGIISSVQKALDEIIQGRRILKNSYVFGYYADWSRSSDGLVLSLYEFQQGQLESTLDALQEMTEGVDLNSPDWMKSSQITLTLKNQTQPIVLSSQEFIVRLADLTRIVKSFFENMSRCFEEEIIPVVIPKRIDNKPCEPVDVTIFDALKDGKDATDETTSSSSSARQRNLRNR